MKDIYILGIETSCDETSAAIVKNGNIDIATVILSQIDVHSDYGGVVPEIASREHVRNITIVIEECLKKADMKIEDIDAIAVTYGPGLIGSLLIGLEAAKTLAFLHNKPLIPVHHIAGHIYANKLIKDIKYPALALVISGGHTELVYMEKEYDFIPLGGTLDDAVGECYDKVARLMNAGYPGGPIIDKMAETGNPTYNLPLPLNDNSCNFSFSGLKSAVVNLVHNETQRGNTIRKEDLSTSFQNIIVETLAKKTKKAIIDKQIEMLILAGGVAANKGIRNKLESLCIENNIEYIFPDIKYCTDNAAMIAAAGYILYNKGIRADICLNAKSSEKLS